MIPAVGRMAALEPIPSGKTRIRRVKQHSKVLADIRASAHRRAAALPAEPRPPRAASPRKKRSKGFFCEYCRSSTKAPEASFACACQKARYCSMACAERHAATHSPFCAILSRRRSQSAGPRKPLVDLPVVAPR